MKISMLMLLLLLVLSSHRSVPSCAKIDLMLVGDFSGSVDGYQKTVADAFISFASSFDLSDEGMKIGAVVFNGNAVLVSDLTGDKIQLYRDVLSLKSMQPVGSTYLSSGVDMAVSKLFGSNARVGYRKIIVIVSDGVADDGHKALEKIDAMKTMSIVFCTVLVKTNMYDAEYMQRISSNCYVETDYEGLVNEIKKLDICL